MNIKKMFADSTPDCFKIKNQAGAEAAEIYIDGIVGGGFFEDGTTSKNFVNQCQKLKESVLNVHINSPGGSVMDGVTIYNYLSNCGKKVNVFIDGIAASIASVIAMAGDKITIAESGFMMIHNPSALSFGNCDAMRAVAAELEKIQVTLEKVYKDRTGLTLMKIRDLMKGQEGADGTLMTAEEALENGFVTDIAENKTQTRAVALAGIKAYWNVAESTSAQDDPPKDPPKTEPENEDDPPKDPPKTEPENEDDPPKDPPKTEPENKDGESPDKKEIENLKNQIAALNAQNEELKAEAARMDAIRLKALSPALNGINLEPATWTDALKACGGDYVEASKKYPELKNSAIKKFNRG